MTGSVVIDRAPPGTSAGGGGGGWALLLIARGVIEAELVRGVLESSGIVPVALDATDPSPGSWMFLSGNVNALVRVFVPRSLLEAARLAMLEAGIDAPAADEPEPKRRAPGWMVAVALIAVAAAVAIILVVTWYAHATCALRLYC